MILFLKAGVYVMILWLIIFDETKQNETKRDEKWYLTKTNKTSSKTKKFANYMNQ